MVQRRVMQLREEGNMSKVKLWSWDWKAGCYILIPEYTSVPTMFQLKF